jgi:hypothetical protein
MRTRGFLLAGLAWTAFIAGCGGVREETITTTPENDPLYQPRQLLQRYADGQRMGSEASNFPQMVERVRKVDPATADVLQKGLDDLVKAPPGARRAKAKELLSKIQPKAYGSGPAEGGDAAGGEKPATPS